MEINLEAATVEAFQEYEKGFLGFTRPATEEQAQRYFIGQAISKCVDKVRTSNAYISILLDETALGKEDLKVLMDTKLIHNGATFYFYSISVEVEDRGDDLTFGGLKRWIEIEFRVV